MVTGRAFAETVALKALGWLASQEDMLGGFLSEIDCCSDNNC